VGSSHPRGVSTAALFAFFPETLRPKYIEGILISRFPCGGWIYVFLYYQPHQGLNCVPPPVIKSYQGEVHGFIREMWPLIVSDSTLTELWAGCSSCSPRDRKALITLARSQSIPDSNSPILLAKVQPILDRMTDTPPFTNISTTTLNLFGLAILTLIQQPHLCGLLIVYSLGAPQSESIIADGFFESFRKELSATQTRRKPSTWNWDAILSGRLPRGSIVHEGVPDLSPLHRRFASSLRLFRTRQEGRIIFPHYSRRGVSRETASLLLNRIDKRAQRVHGPRHTFHRHLKYGNITSLDIVHNYIRTGIWIRGRTEMKQRWYPNGLVPRTYFSWGGDAIVYSSYLRGFFNDLADTFGPTQRHNRVQPDWLLDSRITSTGGFGFYDLTSFTSWFHEQVPFLWSLSRYFSGVTVFLLGPELGLIESDLGCMIENYIRWCNDFPSFVLSRKLSQDVVDIVVYSHQCAGFLGVPGNLITCTLPHGLAIASNFTEDRQIQIPGDDVGFSFLDEDHKSDTLKLAGSLGVLQYDKVYFLPQLCVYLKRRVIDLGTSIQLADMLIYPLLPYLIPRDAQRSNLPPQYRLPDPADVTRRACAVLAAFHRDLWDITGGSISVSDNNLILSFLRGIHRLMHIPEGAVFQSRLYGEDGFVEHSDLQGVTIKFPVDDDDCLYYDPVLSFSSRYVETMRIRSTLDVKVTEDIQDLYAGQTIFVPKKRGWTFLEDMGYVDIVGIPGEVITLFGVDAKEAFLMSKEPNLREVHVLADIKVCQLVSLGILQPSDSNLGEFIGGFGYVERDIRSEQSWRYGRYIDLDDPKGFGRSSKAGGRIWGRVDRQSLSPEPQDVSLDY
jgi:hypothetical protein